MAEQKPHLNLEQYAQELNYDPEFIAERLSIKIVEEMLQLLEDRGLTQSWLAEKMGVSRAHISKILNAAPNMTLLTIAKIAVALGTTPDMSLNAKSEKLNKLPPSIDFSWLSNAQHAYPEEKVIASTTGITTNTPSRITNNPGEIASPESVRTGGQMLANEPDLVLAA
jgi:transcriptional regulator with XRE-family HTH domain